MTQIESKTETRLEAHRRQFVKADYTGPLIRVDDLTPREIELINADFLERCRGSAEDINQIYLAYVETLHSWGVICPHPQQHRMYEGYLKTDVPISFADGRWYDCRLCGAAVINR